MTKKPWGGARYSTRPDAKPRGPAPDLVKAARRITAAIRRHGVRIEDRDKLYAALTEAQRELDSNVAAPRCGRGREKDMKTIQSMGNEELAKYEELRQQSGANEPINRLIRLHEEVARSIDEIAARERDCGSPPVIAEHLRALL